MDQSINPIHIDHPVARFYILYSTLYLTYLLYYISFCVTLYFLLGNDGMESAIFYKAVPWKNDLQLLLFAILLLLMLTHSLENQHVVCTTMWWNFNCLFLLISSLFYSLYANINFSLLDSAEWCIIRYKKLLMPIPIALKVLPAYVV